MFNNTALDVSIGLIFIFLLYSLLATIIQELVARWLGLRPRMLVKAIRTMLEDRTHPDMPRFDDSFWSYLRKYFIRVRSAIKLNWVHFKCPLKNTGVAKEFFDHPAIKYLAESSWHSKPAYIEASNFSTTVMQLLRGPDYDGSRSQMTHIGETIANGAITVKKEKGGIVHTIDKDTLHQLHMLYIDAQKDSDRFRALLESWYTDTMDRVSGWYKRQTQFVLLIIGTVLAVTFNADTIAITNILAKDKGAREQLVQLAIASQGKYDTLTRRLAPVMSVTDSLKTRVVAGTDSATKQPILKDTTFYTYTRSIPVTDTILSQAYSSVMGDLEKANYTIGLGWDYNDTNCGCRVVIDSVKKSSLPEAQRTLVIKALTESDACREDCASHGFLKFHPLQKGGLYTIIGWLITALAVSLGAPFWFDILNKVIRMRSSGVKPVAGENKGQTKDADNAGLSSTQR